jgi:sulfide:quinone oxidoreductase
MTSEQPQTDVLIVGGGVAALEAALALRERGAGFVRTTLLAPNAEFSNHAVSVGEPFGLREARSYSLDQIANDLGIVHHTGSLRWVDTHEQIVHTEQELALSYDALLLAVGARTHPQLAHAVTLDPSRLDEQMHGVIQDVEGGYLHSIAFVIPSPHAWPLPVYELALMTAKRAWEMGVELSVTVITPESAPLAVFGDTLSRELRELLNSRRITTLTSSHCTMREPHKLRVHPAEQELVVDQVIALPDLSGPALAGIPRSAIDGFISTGRDGRVHGLERVFAAGDLTDFPVKYGGLAAQQADAAADSIAALAGADIAPEPFNPKIHGQLWGGGDPLYFTARITGTLGLSCAVATQPMWTPATKVRARYLEPYLESLDRAAASVL